MNKIVKKTLKILLITLGSLLLLIGIAIGTILYIIFTPEQLAPIVKTQVNNFITAESHFGAVELTIFSTFPKVSLKIDDVHLINAIEESAKDTVLRANTVYASLNLMALLKEQKLLVDGITLTDADIYAFVNSKKEANYMVVELEEDTLDQDTSSFVIDIMDFKRVKLDNVSVHYQDKSAHLNTYANNINASVKGHFEDKSMDCSVDLETGNLHFKSGDTSSTYFAGQNLELTSKINIAKRLVSAEMEILSDGLKLMLDTNTYFNQALRIKAEGNYHLGTNDITLDTFNMHTQGAELAFSGMIAKDSIKRLHHVGLKTKIEVEDVAHVLAILPPEVKPMVKDVTAEGKITFIGDLKGDLNRRRKIYPAANGELILDDIEFLFHQIPDLPLDHLDAHFAFFLNPMTKDARFTVKNLDFTMLKSHFFMRGELTDVFTDPNFRGIMNTSLDMPTLTEHILDTLGYQATGKAEIKSHLKTTLSQAKKKDIHNIIFYGDVELYDFSFLSAKDTLWAKTDLADVSFQTQAPKQENEPNFLVANIVTKNLYLSKGSSRTFDLKGADIHLAASDFTDTTLLTELNLTYNIAEMDARLDNMSLATHSFVGKALIKESGKIHKPIYQFKTNAQKVIAGINQDQISIDAIDVDFTIIENKEEEHILMRMMPVGNFKLTNAVLKAKAIQHPVQLKGLGMELRPNYYAINEGELIIDRSRFSLVGGFHNLVNYYKGRGVLKGNFFFNSDYTDIGTLMTLFSKDTTAANNAEIAKIIESTEEVESDTSSGAMPTFIVPEKIDVIFKSNIKKADYNGAVLSDVKGNIVIKEGELLLDSISVTTPVCHAQLNAIYRSPEVNNLFLGMDYHMRDIEIGNLLVMFPNLDTVMPMLRSFKGNAEFHIVAETNLDSTYTPKMETLKGAAAINGQNLVLLDGETFTTISRKLLFSRKAENEIKSISAEFILDSGIVNIYPFSFALDKYKVVLSGEHSLDMNFKYHISVVKSPLPFRLGVNVEGNLDKLKIRLGKCKYAKFYEPTKQSAVLQEQLSVKKLIQKSLLTGGTQPPEGESEVKQKDGESE